MVKSEGKYMDPRLQANRPTSRANATERRAQNAAPQQQTQTTTGTPSHQSPAYRKGTSKKKIAFSIVAALVLVLAGFGIGAYAPITGGEYSRVDKSKYQAVFLANDQVYFGKITSISSDAFVITDIYYLQKQADQTADAKQAGANPTQQANMSLAKLGDELHAPEDRMNINRDQVLFWENLKPTGKVAEAIKAYKK